MTNGASPAPAAPLMSLEDIHKDYLISKPLLGMGRAVTLSAVDGVSLDLRHGETLSLVGESGCGKTTLGKVALLMEKPTGGQVRYMGKNVLGLSKQEYKEYRVAVQAVFQDPWSSLNPGMRVARILAEPLEVNGLGLSKTAIRERVERVLNSVGLNTFHLAKFPHEFSGGQRQRIATARALILQPKLIVLDEPVSALDVSIRAQVMNLLKKLQGEYGLAYFLIAHDLATVRHMSHTVAVMYLGRIVEIGESEQLFSQPLHPYTKGLIAAALPSGHALAREMVELTGEVPSPLRPPSGCRFRTRCPFAMPICAEVAPELKRQSPTHRVACHLFEKG